MSQGMPGIHGGRGRVGERGMQVSNEKKFYLQIPLLNSGAYYHLTSILEAWGRGGLKGGSYLRGRREEIFQRKLQLSFTIIIFIHI